MTGILTLGEPEAPYEDGALQTVIGSPRER